MKVYITVLLLLISFLLSAQTKKHKHKTQVKNHKPLFQEYYIANNLNPANAVTPYLYYQVYDWAGTHYKYAGCTKNGIDCSGFVAEVYKNTYCIDFAGGSKDIWTLVKPVEKKDLKEGDILFFKIKKGQISHVGIYLENNKFAHASVKLGVIISDLDDAYYKKYFYKGGRIINE